jgi:hypothetical protein
MITEYMPTGISRVLEQRLEANRDGVRVSRGETRSLEGSRSGGSSDRSAEYKYVLQLI